MVVDPDAPAAGHSVAMIPDELTKSTPDGKASQPRNSGDYTPRHTWLTVNPGGADVEINYTIIDSTSFSWLLYTRTIRAATGIPGSGFPQIYYATSRHWILPPQIHLFNDSTLVPGYNIDIQFANLVYNVKNILPTFNPRDAKPENVVVHQSFGYILQDNEVGAYFDDAIPGNGVVIRLWSGPRMNKCITSYKSYVGVSGPDVSTFNQELGSCFGAAFEPAWDPQYYLTVFSAPPSSNTYTEDDLKIISVYLGRSKIHYANLSLDFNDLNSKDWEARPDIVEEWYTPENKVVNTHMEIIEYGFEGEVLNRTIYAYNEIPSTIMRENPMLFTLEEVEQRELEERQGLTGQCHRQAAPPPAGHHAVGHGHAPRRTGSSGHALRALQSGRHNDFSTLFQ